MNTFHPYLIPVSVKGIVFEGDCVWLRKNERNEWELPGGKIDKGEQPHETVVRELGEELGFDVHVEKLVYAWVYTINKSPDEAHGVLVLSYLCKLEKKSGKFEKAGEAGKAEFQKHDIKKIYSLNMPEFYKEAIKLGWNVLSESINE